MGTESCCGSNDSPAAGSKIQQGSLCPALYRLERKGLIASEWGESENKRRARCYRLTSWGRKQLKACPCSPATPWTSVSPRPCPIPPIWLILREAFALAAAGIVVGVPVVLALGHLAKASLYGVAPYDPFAFVTAALLLLAFAGFAAVVPSSRASLLDPTTALRRE